MELIDTHAHLDEKAFATDRGRVVQRAADAGVAAVVTIGTTADSSRRAVEIAAEYPAVYAAVGIQPNYVAEARPGDWEAIERLASQPTVVAVGETGLDRYWDFAPLDLQSEYFAKHVALSRRLARPFVVHCRDAENEMVAELRQFASEGALHGVMHSFTGDAETARTCLQLGMHISFAGMITYKKSDALRRVAAEIPLDRLLVETDSPYLAPHPRRGKRNEPAYVVHTVAKLAELHGLTPDEMAEQTTRNAREFFGIA